ncbi:4791_t:CDS:2, partial [Racocetra persica]
STAFTTSIGYINGIWHVIKGFVCLGGLYGAIAQNKNMVQLFAVIISVTAMIHLVFGIGLTIVGLKNRDTLVNLCLQKASSNDTWDPSQHWLRPFDKRADNPDQNATTDHTRIICETAVKWYLAFFIVFTAIAIILTFYFAAIVYRYRDELDEKIKHRKLENQPSNSSSFEDRYSREYLEKPPRGISTNVYLYYFDKCADNTRITLQPVSPASPVQELAVLSRNYSRAGNGVLKKIPMDIVHWVNGHSPFIVTKPYF